MKSILLKIALFFSLLTIPLIGLYLAPYSGEFAYHYIENDCYNHGAWIYDRINHNPTPIDIAFIGSSHTIHAFQDKKIEELIGSNDRVTNLGYCRYGRNLEYILLKMLIDKKSPGLVVFEVHEDEEKNSHDIFPYLADTRDLLQTPTPFNRDYLADLFHGASARLEYFKARFVFREKYPEPVSELYGYGASDRMVTRDELTENEKAWGKRLNRATIEFVEETKVKYPFAYLDKMIRMVEAKKIPFIFVYLPEYGSKLKNPKYEFHYKNMAPVLIPPQLIFSDVSNWMDASHLNDKGSELLSDWMADQLKNEFCNEKSN